MIVKEAPQEWIFEECRKIGKIKFDYSEKSGAMAYATSLAPLMKKFAKPEDVPHILRHRYLQDEFDAKRIQEMAELIADPANSLIFLQSKKFEDSELNKSEDWYKMQFSMEPYSADLLAQINKDVNDNGKKLALPVENTLLPTKFEILPEQKELSSKVNLIQKWDNTELWYKKRRQAQASQGPSLHETLHKRPSVC